MDELEAAVHCNWVANGVGSAEFTMAATDSKATRDNLQFGNFVLFSHPTLSKWGGFLSSPRQWGRYQMTVRAKSAEGMFERRLAPGAGEWSGAARGIFKKVIDRGNSQGDMNVVEGQIGSGSGVKTVELRRQRLSEVIDEIAGGHDWWLEPELDSGNDLQFLANLKAQRGQNKSYPLIEGQNIALTSDVTEGGSLVNDVTAVGEGATEDIMPTGRAVNEESIALYGLTQAAEFLSFAHEGPLLDKAKQKLKREAFPLFSFSAQLLTPLGSDGLPNYEAWQQVKMGDSFPVVLDSAGFLGGGTGARMRARVMGMEYDSGENSLIANFEQEAITPED